MPRLNLGRRGSRRRPDCSANRSHLEVMRWLCDADGRRPCACKTRSSASGPPRRAAVSMSVPAVPARRRPDSVAAACWCITTGYMRAGASPRTARAGTWRCRPTGCVAGPDAFALARCGGCRLPRGRRGFRLPLPERSGRDRGGSQGVGLVELGISMRHLDSASVRFARGRRLAAGVSGLLY